MELLRLLGLFSERSFGSAMESSTSITMLSDACTRVDFDSSAETSRRSAVSAIIDLKKRL